MLKKLFDFKGSKLKKIYKGILLISIVAAIAITAIGLVESVDMAGMKAALGVTKLIAGDVMLFVLKKYLVWALLVLAVGVVCYYVLRAKDRKAQAAA